MSNAPVTSRHKPMVVKPDLWAGPRSGGYKWLKVDIMRTHGSKMQEVSKSYFGKVRKTCCFVQNGLLATFTIASTAGCRTFHCL
jgi:hypothetical protein